MPVRFRESVIHIRGRRHPQCGIELYLDADNNEETDAAWDILWNFLVEHGWAEDDVVVNPVDSGEDAD